MERLTIDEVIEHCNRQTERMENNFGRSQLEEKPMMGNLNIMKHYWEHRQVAKWLKELKEYRDLEEQERLIGLPCKVGDEFWVVAYCDKTMIYVRCTGYTIQVDTVNMINHAYLWLNSVDEPMDYWKLTFNEFYKRCFKTKEEAEKALEKTGCE